MTISTALDVLKVASQSRLMGPNLETNLLGCMQRKTDRTARGTVQEGNKRVTTALYKKLILSISCYRVEVVTASPEAGSSRAKIDMAFFDWFWLIVESGNILRLRRPLCANSSAAEVKKERVEAFTCESFYLLLLSFFSCVFVVELSKQRN